MARIEQSVEVNAAPEVVYERLLHFDEYPSFMQDVRQVRRIGATGLQWETGHGERARSWQAEITEQIPYRHIAWRHVHGPRYEAGFELSALNALAGAGGMPTSMTRVKLVIECEPDEQALPTHGNAQQMLDARAMQDLARLKKHLEHHEPSGVHVARAGWAGPRNSGQAEPLGKTIGQTAAEREESAQSASPHERSAFPWKRRAPSLPELWDLCQQPLRVARRVSHDVERVIDSVRGRSGSDGEQSSSMQGAGGEAWTPMVETAQRERKFVVCAELPGMKSDDVQVEIKHDRITIAGERRPEPPHEPHEERRSERRYGRFYRAIPLPPGAQPEQASAEMHDGVLEITVPLAEFANRPRRLEVRSAP